MQASWSHSLPFSENFGTVYANQSTKTEKGSHFPPLKDNVRIGEWLLYEIKQGVIEFIKI